MERTLVISNNRETLMHYVVELCKIYNWRFSFLRCQSSLKVNFHGFYILQDVCCVDY